MQTSTLIASVNRRPNGAQSGIIGDANDPSPSNTANNALDNVIKRKPVTNSLMSTRLSINIQCSREV